MFDGERHRCLDCRRWLYEWGDAEFDTNGGFVSGPDGWVCDSCYRKRHPADFCNPPVPDFSNLCLEERQKETIKKHQKQAV